MSHFNKRTMSYIILVSLLGLQVLTASELFKSQYSTSVSTIPVLPNSSAGLELDPGLVQLDTKGIQPVGQINISNFFIIQGGCLDWGGELPNVTLLLWGVNKSDTVTNASVTNWDSETQTAKLKVTWNESVLWTNFSTWDSGEKVVNYTSRIFHEQSEPGAILESIWYNTTPAGDFLQFPEANYSMHFEAKEDGGYDYAVFDLQSYFLGKVNGSMHMHFVYSYEFEVTNWNTKSRFNEKVYISNGTNEVRSEFLTEFRLDGDEQLGLTLLVCPPDKSEIWNASIAWKEYDDRYYEEIPAANLTKPADNQFSVYITASKRDFNMTYLANYTLEFVNSTKQNLWASDRLVSGLSIRQRDFIINLTDGPMSLLLPNIQFNTTLPTTVRSYTDAFSRGVTKLTQNLTSVPNYASATGFLVSNYILEYMQTGEIDKVTVEYEPDSYLNILIADAISFPLPDVEVVLYINGIRFGAKIATDEIRPYPSLITDDRGQVKFDYLPNLQNYTVEVFQNGQSKGTYEVTPTKTINFVVTTIPHFPTWIIVWLSISAAVLCVGVVLYRKNKIQS